MASFSINLISNTNYTKSSDGKQSCSTSGILTGVTFDQGLTPPETHSDWISAAYAYLDTDYAVGSLHPYTAIPMTLKTRQVKVISFTDTTPVTAKFEVTLTYDNDVVVYRQQQYDSATIVSFTGSLEQHETDKDINGTPITVSYTGEESQSVPINKDFIAPAITIEYTTPKSGYNPLTNILTYLNTTNNAQWAFSGDTGLWKCTQFDVEDAGDNYNIRFVANYSAVGWKGLVAWTNENGKVPDDARSVSGAIAEPVLYNSSNFSSFYSF